MRGTRPGSAGSRIRDAGNAEEALVYQEPRESAATTLDAGGAATAARSLEHQHVQLRRALAGLANLLGGWPNDPERLPTELQRRAAREAFAGLEVQLLTHLDDEERGGRLALALAVAPQLQRSADRLLEDHARLRASVGALVADVRRAGAAPSAWRALRDDFAALRHVLAVHDSAESALLQRAHGEDLGGRG